MAVEFIASQSLSNAANYRRGIASVAPAELSTTTLTPGSSGPLGPSTVSTPSRVNLPSGIRTSQGTLASADVSVARARQMISDALVAAHKVLDALDTLSSVLNIRGFTSLTDNESAITLGGTRVSGVTIEAASSRIVNAIDELVSDLGQHGINLISSSSRSIRIQTSGFGGRITVTPQPLDSSGLNIRDLAAVDRYDAKEAKGRVDIARYNVTLGIQNLEALQRSLSQGTASSRTLSAISSPGDGISSRGALIDLQA